MSSSKAPSQRQLRVGEQIRHILSQRIRDGHFRDPDLQGASITVTEVQVSPDLRNATAFVMTLGGREVGPVTEALNRAASYLRTETAHEMRLKYAPNLTFRIDETFDEADRIERLLAEHPTRPEDES